MRRRVAADTVTVALAGNPNVGKSTVFNALTGLRQHTGNWPGKTVESAEGFCRVGNRRWRLVDLPGTYSLFVRSGEEAVARAFLCDTPPQAVIAVCDATCLARSLILALQIMQLTPRVVVCVNLTDEAARRGMAIDLAQLQANLGVPVVATDASRKKGLPQLMQAVESVLQTPPQPTAIRYTAPINAARERLAAALPQTGPFPPSAAALYALQEADWLKKWGVPETVRDEALRAAADAGLPPDKIGAAVASCAVLHAESMTADAVRVVSADTTRRDRRWDRWLSGRWTAFPIMGLLLCVVLWLTVWGANTVSEGLSWLFGWGGDGLRAGLTLCHAPEWLVGVLVDGAYGVLSWVVAVMLPPMAVFFPLFTLLEDAGYLPRLAFNLDRGFCRASSCGKQALTMCMGLGCNAVGVTGCRIMDSPRERVLAAVTNSLVPCNGRFPLLITLTTLFWAGAGPLASLKTAALVAVLLCIGVGVTLAASHLLSATVLKGLPSAFVLELPPYRRPQVGRVLVRSLLDRTLFVLGRAAAVAAPAGVLIWVLANVQVAGQSLVVHLAAALEPAGRFLGMDGTMLSAFVLGWPANETVLPIAVMTYTGGGVPVQPGLAVLRQVLVSQGWNAKTAACVMLFSLFHWPCSTTVWTVWKECRKGRFVALAVLLPTAIGLILCAGIRALFSVWCG